MLREKFSPVLGSISAPARRVWSLAPIVTLRDRMEKVPAELWLGLVLCAAPMILRTGLLVKQSLPWSASDFHGYLSDATIAGVIALVLSTLMRLLQRRARTWLVLLACLAWTTIHMGNYEHISALGAPLQFTYAQYMKDGVFVAGSAFSVSSTALFLLLLAIGSLGALLIARQEFTSLSWQTRTIVVLALAFANSAWPTDPRALAWRDSNFMELLVRPSNAKAVGITQRAPLPAKFRANVAPDLDGTPIIPLGAGRKNVLLVILEGISGGNIPAIASAHGIKQDVNMPELSAIAEKGISYPTFLTNQRQTNRGEFALLCGRLDYLVSGTSRMTEYARDGGEPCLPRVLAENGYRTMYVQPAPLSFMLKDQFMAKAGFTDVHGPELFTKSYARTTWGVDDRAFFEQSVQAIKDLNDSGSPWFTAMLTVGTHHPYTVPASFKTGDSALDGDPHARAVRYLDRAVAAFVADLEKAKLLDNTLLLITSDESFGVEGYDDLTRRFSYNWGFLIAKPPGEAPQVVTRPHAQVDVALTIADYLGISTTTFVGRSLFREYEDARHLVFANTYQQKIYWAAPPEIVECDEAVANCTKHVVSGQGLFGTERNGAAATDSDTNPLREMVALTSTRTSQDISGRTPLMLDNAAVWDVGAGRQNIVFAGQYFTLGAEDEVVVSVDATLDGPGASLIVDADVFSAGRLYEVFPPPLYDGDRLQLEFAYAPGRQLNSVEVRMQGRKHDGVARRLIMKKAEMRVRKRTLEQHGGVTTQFRVDRANPRQVYFIGSGTIGAAPKPGFALNSCITKSEGKDFVAKGCAGGALIYGPYAKVEARTTLRATFDVASLKGTVNLRLELVSAAGKVVYASTKPITVKEKNAVPISLDARLDSAAEGVEARLALLSGMDDAELTIRRAVLEAIPDLP